MPTSAAGLIALGFFALLGVALFPFPESPRGVKVAVPLALAAAAAAVLVALVTAAVIAVHGPVRTPLLGAAGIGLSLYLDALSGMMLCLVSFIGLIVIAYSDHYLDGDPGHVRFVRGLCLTLAAILLVIVSGNLLQFALAWIATSVALNRLLVFYPHRQAAVLAARKKFLASRLGDVCLITAIWLMYRQYGSLDYTDLFAAAARIVPGTAPPSLHAVALLLVVTGLLKSAQFPTHGWLIEVMETPTPVSALLHAGIINAGGFLVLRFADVISLSTPALYLLVAAGGFTALFGSVVMLPQTSIKVSLAYSTIAQMGFMMLECGLGAYSAALLHILAHSCYKAHAFLSSGSVIDIARASWTPSPGGRPHPLRLAISIAAVLIVAVMVSSAFGASFTQQPGVFAMGAVVVLGLIHLVANGIDERPNGYVVGRIVALAIVVSCVYFGLQYVMERLLTGSLPPTLGARGPAELAAVVLIIFSFAVVTLLQSLLPHDSMDPRWQAVYAHVSNGLYVNTLANRWVLRFWPSPPR